MSLLLLILNAGGATGGILGGIFVAYARKEGFYIWLVGNTLWVAYGLLTRNWPIVAQFAFFQAISIKGIMNWKEKGIG